LLEAGFGTGQMLVHKEKAPVKRADDYSKFSPAQVQSGSGGITKREAA
jgi:hypothetical protein